LRRSKLIGGDEVVTDPRSLKEAKDVLKIVGRIRSLRAVRLETDVQAVAPLSFTGFKGSGTFAAPVRGKIETNPLSGVANTIHGKLHVQRFREPKQELARGGRFIGCSKVWRQCKQWMCGCGDDNILIRR
jgi:hypothetical protein